MYTGRMGGISRAGAGETDGEKGLSMKEKAWQLGWPSDGLEDVESLTKFLQIRALSWSRLLKIRGPCPLSSGMHRLGAPKMEQELWKLWQLWLGSSAVTVMWEPRPRKAVGVGNLELHTYLGGMSEPS